MGRLLNLICLNDFTTMFTGTMNRYPPLPLLNELAKVATTTRFMICFHMTSIIDVITVISLSDEVRPLISLRVYQDNSHPYLIVVDRYPRMCPSNSYLLLI